MTLLRIILLLLLVAGPSVSAQTGTTPSDPSREPIMRLGLTVRSIAVSNGFSLRLEIEPVRDVIGIWGEVGFVTAIRKSNPFSYPTKSSSPSILDLGAGIRIHPLPFGDVARIYVDGAVKSYWDRNLWSTGAGVHMLPDFRNTPYHVTLGLSYDWEASARPDDDTTAIDGRPDESLKARRARETWEMMWVNATFSYGFVPSPWIGWK